MTAGADDAGGPDAQHARRAAPTIADRATTAGLALLTLLSRLPLRPLRIIGGAMGTLAWWLARPRRHVTLVNLRLCFPHLSERERRRLGHAHFRAFMRSILERFIVWRGPTERIRALVRIEGLEQVQPHLGRPLILLAPHFVALDAGGMRLSLEHGAVTMYQRQKNAVVDDAMRAGRERFGNVVALSRQDGVKTALRLIRRGTPFYYLPDMDLGARDAVFVPFFGVPAATVTGAARLAALSGATVVPFVTLMTRDGYVGRFFEPWHDFPGPDPVAATARMNAFIEAQVREAPEQYLWSHKRFKTRPPGEPDPYSG